MQRANNSQSHVADSVCESLLRWTEDNELVHICLKRFQPVDGLIASASSKRALSSTTVLL